LLAGVIVVGSVLAVALLVSNLLGDAALFFYNADEAVERRAELGDQRFRIQGTPISEASESFADTDDRVVLNFAISYEQATVDVVHAGDPPELFQAGVPVVLEGSWVQGSGPVADDGWHFKSDHMLVKHDNDYRNRDDYNERISDAEGGGTAS